MRKILSTAFLFIVIPFTFGLAEDGYDLWLRYVPVKQKERLQQYRQSINEIVIHGQSATIDATREELTRAFNGMLQKDVKVVKDLKSQGTLVLGIARNSELIASLKPEGWFGQLGSEGFSIFTGNVQGKKIIAIVANEDKGLLYGTFHFIGLLQTEQDISKLDIIEVPKTTHRILNHWDNLDRTVERGYAGFSLWEWHVLPDVVNPRYKDYARANASIGINGSVLTNVNANALVLTDHYLKKVAAIADVFRPYGIKVYLTARFSAPIEIGGLSTADPLNSEVRAWWQNKAKEIYTVIPDFGGFLVKANSEGQPGPQDYGRSHAEGANMLAEAVEPFGGIVMWRAFVYSAEVPEDRAKQAYNEFVPLDGRFMNNVFVQVKNGPIDFQPREPFHPLFGAMPETPLMMEFQITQEYLGFSTHLVYLATLFKECLESDTYAKGKGSTVAKVVDGTLYNQKMSGMAGVANIGTDRNWTGHPFGQANWYSFGRLAWNHALSSEQIAREWLQKTFSNHSTFNDAISEIMLASREAAVNYMTPLGLHHQMAEGHHYGPGPWVSEGRPDWTSVYYHRADSAGIGFDRSSSGSNAVAQYFPPLPEIFGNIKTCPEKYLLWFHHVNWEHEMNSGRTLWEELCFKHHQGIETVQWMQKVWREQKSRVDAERFKQVNSRLNIQEREAIWWKDALLLYFQQFSGQPIPEKYNPPLHNLEYYMNLDFQYVR